MPYSIAIDGPAGAGKSTIAKAVAKSLGYYYVDTGALYRGLAFGLLQKGVPFGDEQAVEKEIQNIHVELLYENGVQKVLSNGEDCSAFIRTSEIGEGASVISQYPAVREKLLDLQRNVARQHSCVMDGRDIGSVVLPYANKKFFLTASAEVRARRRTLEFQEKGEPADYESILEEVKKRDERDMNRSVAPLKQVEDAVLIDSSNLSIDGVVDTILGYCVGSEA